MLVPHPPYSPDLLLYDFFLFPKFKVALNRRFNDVTTIQAKWQNALGKFQTNDYRKHFEWWHNHQAQCMKSQGNYFEEDNIG
jgi:hypothetical protein